MSVLGIQVGQGIQQAVDHTRIEARKAKQLEIEREMAKDEYAIRNNVDQTAMANELAQAQVALETVQNDLSQTRLSQSKLQMGGAFRMLRAGNYAGFMQIVARDKKENGADSIAHQIPWIEGLRKLTPERNDDDKELYTQAVDQLEADIADRLGYSEQDMTDPEKAKQVKTLAKREGFIYAADIDKDGNLDYFTDRRLFTSLGGLAPDEIEDYSTDLRLVPEGLGRPLTDEEIEDAKAARKKANRPAPTSATERISEDLGEFAGELADAVLTGSPENTTTLLDSVYSGERSVVGGEFVKRKELKGRAFLDALTLIDGRGRRQGFTEEQVDTRWLASRDVYITNLRDYWRSDEAKKKDPTFATFEEVHKRFNELQNWTNRLTDDEGVFGTKEDVAVAIEWISEVFGISDVNTASDLLRQLEKSETDTLVARIATAIAGTQITEGEIQNILSPIAGKGKGETAKFLVRMKMLDTLATRRLELGRNRETKNSTAAELSDDIAFIAGNNMLAFKEHIAKDNNMPMEWQHSPSERFRKDRMVQRTGMSVNSVSLNKAANTRFISLYGYGDPRATVLFEANLFALATGAGKGDEVGTNIIKYSTYMDNYMAENGTDFDGFTYTRSMRDQDLKTLLKQRYKPKSQEVDDAINRLTYAYEVARKSGTPAQPTDETDDTQDQPQETRRRLVPTPPSN